MSIITKKQSVPTKRKISFEVENMQTQYSMLGYRTDLYFHYYKLAIQTNETDHSDGNIDYEIKRKKSNRTRTCL